ncbi:MAG: ABC transporter substrate-binding protein, partial [Candidatus Polarisedimenticolia bacterium]
MGASHRRRIISRRRPEGPALLLAWGLAACGPAACGPAPPPPPPEEAVQVPGEGTVAVWVEAPRRLAGPLLKMFEEQSGIDVVPQYRETLGDRFEESVRAEAAAGRVDLVWTASPLLAARLAEDGHAAPFRPLGARAVPMQYRDPGYRWIGVAANPRVIIYNNERLTREQAPTSIHNLASPPWAGRAALARIDSGGAAFQAAALFAAWGDERAREFFGRVRDGGARIVADDAAVRRAVTSGEALWGFIGLDEAIGAKREGEPVHIFYPDRMTAPGTSVPPHAAVLLRNAPNPAQARGLFAYLFTTEAGFALGTNDCPLVPILPDVPKHDWVPALSTFNIMRVDNDAVFRAYRRQAAYLEEWSAAADAPAPAPVPRAPPA